LNLLDEGTGNRIGVPANRDDEARPAAVLKEERHAVVQAVADARRRRRPPESASNSAEERLVFGQRYDAPRHPQRLAVVGLERMAQERRHSDRDLAIVFGNTFCSGM
jgi:hypothetical protein